MSEICTLRELAEEIAQRYEVDIDSALTSVTTYASQCDVPGIIEGGQAPYVTIDAETAMHIRNAYAAQDAIDAEWAE